MRVLLVYTNESKKRMCKEEALLEMEKTTRDDWMRWNMKTSIAMIEASPIQIKKKAKYYFYYCPIFDFWAFGKTEEEAWRRLKEDLFLLSIKCSKHESRPKVFRGHTYLSTETRA